MSPSSDDRPTVRDLVPEVEDEMDTTQTVGIPTPTPAPPDKSLARLVVLSGGQVGRTYVIGSDTTIGRSPEMTIDLDDGRVSRCHAVLRPLNSGGFEIEDLDSRNGTTIDGMPVTRQTLDYGSRIRIGAHILLFTYHDPVHEQVLHRQRLEAVGQLAGGVAHDFNNLLGAGVATLEYLDTLPPERHLGAAEVRECLADLRAALLRGEELTRRLLGFQRRGAAEHGAVDITALCEEVVGLARRTLGQSIELRPEIQPGLVVHGHQGELHQVLMNLLINARDAMADGGKITFVATLSAPKSPLSANHSSGGHHVVLAVSDNGPGIDEEALPHLFEPFFTTKKGEAGTGLGLATVKEVVTAHGGTVRVYSRVGEGTTFSVNLPARAAVDKTSPRPASHMTLEQVSARIGRVLIVDDEELVRRSLGRLLRNAGHIVLEARDGEEAVQAFHNPLERPELVLLDIEMPGLDGVATLERIRDLAPTVGVVCVTGRQDHRKVQSLRRLGINGMLEKPFEARALLLAVAVGLGMSR